LAGPPEILTISDYKNLQQVALYTKQACKGTMTESAILKFVRTDEAQKC